MYLVELGVKWAMHPFLHNQFELDTASIRKIRDLGITRVKVDPRRGRGAADGGSAKEAEPPPRRASKAKGDGDGRRWARQLTQEARSAVRDLVRDARAGRALRMQDIDEISEELSVALYEHPDAMLAFGRIRSRDQYTYQHSVNVGVLLMAFARYLRMPEPHVRALGSAGIVHDIGKTLLPDAIIAKPGPLTPEEYQQVKDHPWRGAELLRQTPGATSLAVRIAEQHHERIDGTGYPYGLSGRELSIETRMAAIVDVYDAVTAIRSYHRGRPPTEGLRIIASEAGQALDATLIRRFVRCVGIYPPGSLVRLSTGKLAVVLEAHKRAADKPRVRVVYDISAERMIDPPPILDLSQGHPAHRIERAEDPASWALPPERFL
ncbi:metal dependent phosphohydrolase [Halorhodospira halophila SL1]|uniref:Metal dependent phosphohydrolase n=2 Tax=Halorhodospira halophila TaxID=1053 RepID=A1WY67_HALHL|nr:metal dependent phosphohydrolase [Halorhodospira halophila SL1]